MSYYPEPNNHIRDKMKVILDLLNYGTEKIYKILQVLIQSIYLLKKILLLWKLKLTNKALINWFMFQLVRII